MVSAYGQAVSACALGQTSAAVVAANIVGATADELRLVRTQMIAMLKADGAPPTGERWADLKYLEPVREYKPRHASTLLVFDAVVDALDAIAAKAESPRRLRPHPDGSSHRRRSGGSSTARSSCSPTA